jgi:hypothetical protein
MTGPSIEGILLDVVMLAAVAASVAAATWYYCASVRRRRSERAEWEAFASGARDLDAELDFVWEQELQRHGRDL